jgi:hypothetical protein
MDYGRPMRALKASLATPLEEMRNREGPHRLYAETNDHTHCDAQTSDALADGTTAAHLTVKTVADPKPFSHGSEAARNAAWCKQLLGDIFLNRLFRNRES